ncbi:hypothetical protein BVY03_04555 [bacterium K02(2017)]|nr:hypothetical protein BVY03_04555 [bacterium K02(2017)]
MQDCNASCSGFNICQTTQSCNDSQINGNEVCDSNQRACTTASGQTGTQDCSIDCSGFNVCVATDVNNQNNNSTPIGTNLGDINDYSGVWPYVNAFKHSRTWISGENYGCWDCGPALDLDANGWIRSLAPNNVARTIIYSGLPGRYPSGQYTILYDGEGQLEYWGGGPQINNIVRSAGRDVVQVDSLQGDFFINLIQTNPSNYMRNIRVIVPGGSCAADQFKYCENDLACGESDTCQIFNESANPQTFHPTFLNDNKSYTVLRYMDWMHTNFSEIRNLSDYSQMTDAQWNNGAPIEIMVELANVLQADPWFTIPHLATNEFVQEFATRVLANLNLNRKIYIEYSNEVWNGIFSQNLDVARLGCQRYGDLQAGCDQDANPQNGIYCESYPWPLWNETCNTAGNRYFSDRTVEIGDIFTQVFGGSTRLVKVLASQIGFEWLHTQYLEWNDTYQKIDVLATAPYFGGGYGGDAAVANWDVDRLIADIYQNALPEAIGYIEIDTQFLQNNYPQIDLISYEGGQHLAGLNGLENNEAMTNLFIATNRDLRMHAIYTEYLNAWKNLGGGLFTHFTNALVPSKWGSWGALEYQGQDISEAPKHRAIMDFIENNSN